MSYTAHGTYAEALVRYRHAGSSQADDAALMAAFCRNDLQILVGAVSPRLVWEGAQREGLSAQQLARMTATNPTGVSELQWQ